MSPGAHPGELVYYEKVDRITPGFTDVIHFDILEGNVKAIADPDQVLIPESVARKFFLVKRVPWVSRSFCWMH